MTYQSHNNSRGVPSDLNDAGLARPEGRVRILESDYVNVRFSSSLVDGSPVIHQLFVEARHPKVPGDKRVFDLSPILREVQQRHPATLAQIVDPALSVDSRLDALKVATLNIARIGDVVAPINQVSYASDVPRVRDGQEASFTIKSSVLTEFSDVLRGFSRRGVTVVRNEEPWVQFHIIENREGLCDASLVMLPTGIELPLLDKSGCYVTEQTLNEAIHDLSHLLNKGRYRPELEALGALAGELTERLRRNPDAPDTLKKRNFKLEIVLAARDEALWVNDDRGSQGNQSKRGLTESSEARRLPDGRIVWIGHRNRRISAEISVIGESLEGAQYTLSFHYPPRIGEKVARLARKLRHGGQWPEFKEVSDLLHAVPRSAFSLFVPKSSDCYPAAVNSLIRTVQKALPDIHLERGLPLHRFDRFDEYLPEIVGEFVKGRMPFYGSIEASGPAESWWVLGFLDRDLKGSLYAVNTFGGSVVVSESAFPASAEYRRSEWLRLFNTLSESSGNLTHNPNFHSGLREVRRNLPESSWRDAFAYAAACGVGRVLWAALRKEGRVPPQSRPSDVQWHSERVREGVWSLSVVPPAGPHEAPPYLINCMVGPDGVVEMAYSDGRRGLFGALRGRRVWSQGPIVIPESEVFALTRAIIREERGDLAEGVRETVREISPALTSSWFRWSLMSNADPDRARYDHLGRLWRFLKGIW